MMPDMAKIAADLNSKQRAAEKVAARKCDERRLESGEISRQELARANGAFSSVLHGAEIKSIGGKPLRPLKRSR
jgi:hypothetical protein